jgi:ribosome-associated translation inhibitor RaiA
MPKSKTGDVQPGPPEVLVLHTELRSALREDIEARIERLQTHGGRILRCRATVEGPGRHHRQGHFQLRLRIMLPGREIEISRQSGEHPEEAIREAFLAAGRRIREYLQRIGHRGKTHRARRSVTASAPERGD